MWRRAAGTRGPAVGGGAPLPHHASATLTFMMLPLFSFLPCAATLR